MDFGFSNETEIIILRTIRTFWTFAVVFHWYIWPGLGIKAFPDFGFEKSQGVFCFPIDMVVRNGLCVHLVSFRPVTMVVTVLTTQQYEVHPKS